MRTPTLGTCTKLLVVLTALTLLAGIAAASVSGAIYTTTSTGTTVNGNIYAAKTDVYLNGGPQNAKDPGLVPDGPYYFMVTDPSGAVLLSHDTDDLTTNRGIECREVQVTGGRIVGAIGSCPHVQGTTNPSNGQTPVQLSPYDDTPNPGGEYKAWLTPVANYSPDPANPKCSSKSNITFGFCDSDSKTDNFKVKKAGVAYITVCKFNDLDGSGTQDPGEPLIPFWPIIAKGVDTLTGPLGEVDTQTDATGCVSFSVSSFPNPGTTDTVTLTESLLTGWQETAPLDGTYDANGNPASSGPTSVSLFTQTITVQANDSITAPNFGNTCTVDACGGNTIELTVTKDANPSFTRTYTWGITKTVDNSTVYSAGGGTSGAANYTVSVTHDTGTDSGWQVTGTIKVTNPSLVDVTGVTITDAVDNGATSCTVTGGSSITVPAKTEVDIPYTCSYSASPAPGTNTATASWDSSTAVGTASIDFSGAVPHVVDGSVTVTDTLGGSLGTVSYTDPSPTTFKYSETFTDPAGTCTSHKNTATFTTNTTGTTGSDSKTVTDCQGSDLVVTKTAAAAYTSAITKSVDKTKVEQSGGTITFNYTVKVTTSGWGVSGTITVQNPNDWEAITANLADSLSDTGGSCTIAGGNTQTVPAGSSITPTYNCTFAAVPGASSGTNTAKATWDATANHTPDGSASGTAGYAFSNLTITDCFGAKGASCTTTTLGTVNIPPGSATFTYAHTVNNAAPGTCQEYDNTATIKETGQTANAAVTVCNTKTGGLTMGFWQNKNGQGIITGGASTSGVCNSGTWLRQYAPFQDLSATATCSQVATYVYNIIKAANASGASMNAMLKAQMLATALDVYFSDPSLGGDKVAAYNGGITTKLGGVVIDLTQVCVMIDSTGGTASCSGKTENCVGAFGGVNTCQTVSQLLAYAASQSNAGGSVWYGQVKATQGLAKNTFDAINNQAAYICP